jgi:transcriptional regulator of acetoin/glycerol metabolism
VFSVVERACALADDATITRHDLPDHILHPIPRRGEAPVAAGAGAAPPPALSPGTDLTLNDAKERWIQVLEVFYLRELLERHEGNITAAAKAAGIDRKTYHRLINKHDIK